jgi:hypothetical protein
MADEFKRKKALISEAVVHKMHEKQQSCAMFQDPTIHVTEAGTNVSTTKRVCGGYIL